MILAREKQARQGRRERQYAGILARPRTPHGAALQPLRARRIPRTRHSFRTCGYGRRVSRPELRPLAVGEILDVAIKIYWRNALTLFTLVVFIVLPAQVLVNLVQVSLPDEGDLDESGWAYAAGFLVATVISAVATAIATAACFKAVANAYLGEKADWRSSLRFVLPRTPAVLWVTLLAFLVAGAGLLLLVIPGIYLWVSFGVVMPVLLMEGERGRRALGRSRRLVRGRWWPTFAVLLVGALLTGVVGGLINGLAAGLSFSSGGLDSATGFVAGTVTGTISRTLTTPFGAALATVLYVDLRVRKEGFDLQLLAERIGLAPAGTAFAPPATAPAGPGPAAPGGSQPPYWPPPPGWTPSVDE